MLMPKQVGFSFEIFPPKETSPVETVYKTIDKLKEYSPDFISVTFGAGGGVKSGRTVELSDYIENHCGIPALAHMTCVGMHREDVDAMLLELGAKGVNRILALRGDKKEGMDMESDFTYASDLIRYIKEKDPSFKVYAACYPEGHFESASIEQDIENLARKVDAGAERLITQLFFKNDDFYMFMDKVRARGIEVPVEAGIMPVTSKAGIGRIAEISGARIPNKLRMIMERYDDDPNAIESAGLAYAAAQIVELVAYGVQGVHLYTMNRPSIVKRLWDATGNIFTFLGREQ